MDKTLARGSFILAYEEGEVYSRGEVRGLGVFHMDGSGGVVGMVSYNMGIEKATHSLSP